jgi:preprotein translocase subunit YajC
MRQELIMTGSAAMPFSFITTAHAASDAVTALPAGLVPQPTTTDTLMQFAPLIFIVGLMYFLLIRPQQKRFSEQQTMIKNLRRGDKIVTGGGVFGTIIKLEGEDVVVVDIADGVRVKVQRGTISAVVTAAEPVANGNEPAKPKPT